MISSSILDTKPEEEKGHKATVLKNVLNNGAYKLYTDVDGHVQRTEITLPEGKVFVFKDYEEVPAFAHYKLVTVLSPQSLELGRLSIVPEDRKRPHSTSHFFNEKEIIGAGSGDIGMAIASQLLSIPIDPMQMQGKASVDPGVITSIKTFLQNKK